MRNQIIKDEFESLRTSAAEILERAKKSNRAMTGDEKREIEEKYSRMETLRAANEAVNDVQRDKLLDLVTSNPLEQKQPETFAPLKSGEKLFSKLGLEKPEVTLGQFLRAAVLGPKN